MTEGYLGRMYIARRTCGCISGLVWDDKGHEKSTAKSVAGWIKRGDTIESTERYKGDVQPKWNCEEHKENPDGL